MKNVFYGIALASSLVLTACGGGSSGPAEPLIPGVSSGGGSAQMAPIFAPATGELPIPNDLLFSGTADLTLNIPNSSGNPAITAMNGLDGWSTHAPFVIGFRDNGNTLDAATVIPGQTLRLFKTSVFRPEAIPNTGIPTPTGPVTGIESELTFGVDYVFQMAGPLTIAVIPLKPFEAQASYMVVLTNGMTDSNGTALTGDPQYNISKSVDPLDPNSATGGLEPVRQLVDAMLKVAEGAGIARADAILSYQFTVQSIADALVTAKALYIDFPFSLGALPATSFSSLFTTTAPFGGAGAANLYKGQVTLPYLLGVGSESNADPVLNGHWVTSDMLPDGAGGFFPNPLGGGGNLTYAIPVPAKQADEMVPLMVSLPVNSACPKPYPVMIFQHGITRNRTDMLAVADTMAGTCTAVIAMDQPLHGIAADNLVHLGLQAASGGALGVFEGYAEGALHERTFGVDADEDGTVDSSGAHTINLANLLVARDNLRQASLDLLTLEKGIPAMDVDGDGIPDFDPSKVSFMGHSLGGIVGSTYTALADLAKQSAIVNSSGSIAQMINASLAFGPSVRAGVAAAAGQDPNSAEFLQGTLPTFLFAAQTVVDAGDPINYGGIAQATAVPMLAMQVKNDAVVPNAVATGPFAGSIPLAAMYGLPTVTTTTAADRAFLKFVSGDHSSVLDPTADAAVTVAMQTAIATFIASGGAQVIVTDPALVEP